MTELRAVVLDALSNVGAERVDRSILKVFAERGLLRVATSSSPFRQPPIAAGQILISEIAKAGQLGLGTSVMAETFTVAPLLEQLGTSEHHERFLEPMLQGLCVGSIAITEPGGGSDIVRSIRSSAEKVPDGWIVNGEKLFITNAPVADFAIVLLRTAGADSPIGLSLMVVELDRSGVEVVDTLEKVGLHGSLTGHLRFSDVYVPRTNLIGSLNLGHLAVVQFLAYERVLAAVAAVSAARRALKIGARAIHRVRVRRLNAELEIADLYLREIIRLAGSSPPTQLQSNVAKAVCVELSQAIVREIAAQGHRVDDPWFESVRRDMRVMGVFAGSTETMLDQISLQIVHRSIRGLGVI